MASKTLWFTSSHSTAMGGRRSTFPGVYSCTFDETLGLCDDSQPLDIVSDTTFVEQSQSRGVDISNLKLSASKNKLYGLRTDDLWEILWAPLESNDYATSSGGATTFLSYFRIPKIVYTDRNKGQDCANYAGEQRFAYFEVLPVAFSVDKNDDVFISWEGYFQDCQDQDEASTGLVWSIGVNKVNQSCVIMDDIQSFSDCTTPAAIFYRGYIGKDRRLGNGLTFSSSPSGRQLIYLSAINRAYGVDGANELWVAPLGIHKRPTIVPTPGIPRVTAYQATRIIPDGAIINLNLDENRLPIGSCQTVYSEGVYCYDFRIDDDGETLNATTSMTVPTFIVSKEQIEESCTMDTSVVGGEGWMSGISTGLEVVWGADGRPNVVLFGCYGRLPERGNMTAVLRDGSVAQTLPGAYPGSLLFGVDVSHPDDDGFGFFWSDDEFNPQDTPYGDLGASEGRTYAGETSHIVRTAAIVCGALFAVALVFIANLMFRRKSDMSRANTAVSTKDELFPLPGSTASLDDSRENDTGGNPRSSRTLGETNIESPQKSSRSILQTPSSNSSRSKKRGTASPRLHNLEMGSLPIHGEGDNDDVGPLEKKGHVKKGSSSRQVALSYDSSDEETNDDDLSRIVEMLHGPPQSPCLPVLHTRWSTGDIDAHDKQSHSLEPPCANALEAAIPKFIVAPSPWQLGESARSRSKPRKMHASRSLIMTPAGIMMSPLGGKERIYRSLEDIDAHLKAYESIVDRSNTRRSSSLLAKSLIKGRQKDPAKSFD